MMPPPAYTEARLRAKYHVQVEIEDRELDRTPAHVPVRSRVRRVFRGPDNIRVGDAVRFSVAICREGDCTPPGGDLWMRFDDFEKATYLEAFLDGIPPNCGPMIDRDAMTLRVMTYNILDGGTGRDSTLRRTTIRSWRISRFSCASKPDELQKYLRSEPTREF